MAGKLEVASSVTEAQSHDEGSGGKSVSGVYGSVTGKRTKVSQWAWKCSEYIFGHWKVIKKINNQLDCERVTASRFLFSQDSL